jgi:cytochrome c oxidase subunit 1
MLIRVQLARPNSDFLSADTYNQMFTMHGTTMIFLAVMPLSGAFFNFLIPLMIGARDVAFPRLNAFSFWVLLFGAILINVGWLFGEAPNAGWFSYANLTSSAYSPGRNVDFWILGIQVLGLSSMAAAFNFLVTIINMRAPGMKMMRVPLFAWMTLITSILIVLAFPALTVGTTLLMLDRFYGSNFFNPEAGGSPLLWQHLFWVFGHPEVYILILPAFGIISEVLPVFSRKPLFGYSAVVFAGAGIAVLGFGVWAHHMFTVGMGPLPTSVFAITTMLIALPTGVKIFNWIGTLWGGDLVFKTPMLFALGFIAMFIIGGISGVMHASPPVDAHHQDSYFVVAHFHYVLFGGSLFGLFSGIYYWFPKFSGKMFNEGLGKAHFWLMFAGFNLTFFPMHWLGVQGMPRRIYTYTEEQNWGFWNMFVTLGLFVLVISFVFFIANMWMSLAFGEKAPNDPWDGATLEWAIPSPPPVYNFATIPVVTSRTPLWTEKYPDVYGGDEHGHGIITPSGEDAHAREHAVSGAHGDDHDHAHADHVEHDASHDSIHLPNPSIWPLVTALGIAIAFGGFLVSYLMIGFGVFLLVLGVFSWVLEPAFGHEPLGGHGDDSAHASAH